MDSNKKNMICTNQGPWHLGISEDACKNTGGNWHQSPCVLLKQCIDDCPSGFNSMSPTPWIAKTPQCNRLPTMYLHPCQMTTFNFTRMQQAASYSARSCQSILFRLAWKFWPCVVLVTTKIKTSQARMCCIDMPFVLCPSFHSRTPLTTVSLGFHSRATASWMVLVFKSKRWWMAIPVVPNGS